jgi:HD domain
MVLGEVERQIACEPAPLSLIPDGVPSKWLFAVNATTQLAELIWSAMLYLFQELLPSFPEASAQPRCRASGALRVYERDRYLVLFSLQKAPNLPQLEPAEFRRLGTISTLTGPWNREHYGVPLRSFQIRLSFALPDHLSPLQSVAVKGWRSSWGLPEDQRLALRRGGMVHDIGKVVVPDQILLKPGPLSAQERRLMETHTFVGEQICAPLRSFRNILPIIRSHHEHQNGSGYPDHLTGNQIPLTARILQIADVYDALTTDRPYRAALSSEQAFSTVRLEADRGWWDRKLVDELESLLKNSPELPVAPLASLLGRPAPLGMRYCARCT